MTRRGLMLGRFQPFHKGHLALTKQILSECDELVIIIGSAQFNFIDKDPFSAGERVLMIHKALIQGAILYLSQMMKTMLDGLPTSGQRFHHLMYYTQATTL
jgi:nicotinamide-nucleotide adenylyltransferase